MFKLKGNKEKEFEIIFTKNYSRLYYYALTYINDSETCKDIVNDVFESIWDEYDRIAGNGELTSYLYSCIRNRCVDFIRRQSINNRYIDFQFITAKDETLYQDNEHDERLERIASVIEKMPLRTRFVLEECFYNKKKYREVAEILGITTDGVKKHIVKALKMLRDEFS